MKILLWALALYLTVGAVVAGMMAFVAYTQGDPLPWRIVLRWWLLWPAAWAMRTD